MGVGVSLGVAVAVGLAVALRVAEVGGDVVGVSAGVPVGVALGLGLDVSVGAVEVTLGLMEVETKAGTGVDGACEMRSPKPHASRADKRATAPAPVKK